MADPDRPSKLRTGRLGRFVQLGGMAGGLVGDVALAAGKMAAAASAKAGAERFHKAAADTMLDGLGKMKGLPMKLGQMLSYVDDFIPAEHRDVYRETLSRLQVKVRPMHWEAIAEVLRAELGDDPDEIFSRFDRTPIAAASIGQVYRAALLDGTEVVVKVQYPGIADAIRSDLKNADALITAFSMVARKVDVERSLADVTARLAEECDYRIEADNQAEFVRIWDGDPHVVVPRVHADLSSRTVLVSDYVEGLGWDEMLAAHDDAQKAEWGRLLFRFVFGSLYRHGIFNADPHPGNYLFMADGRVAFIDYGCVQRYEPDTLSAFREVWMQLVSGVRGPPLRGLLARAYQLPEFLDEEVWDFIEDYIITSFEPLLSPQPYRYTRDFTEKVARKAMDGKLLMAKKMLRHGVFEAKQQGIVFMYRINFGLNSILATLGAEADWLEVMAEIDGRRPVPGDSQVEAPSEARASAKPATPDAAAAE